MDAAHFRYICSVLDYLQNTFRCSGRRCGECCQNIRPGWSSILRVRKQLIGVHLKISIPVDSVIFCANAVLSVMLVAAPVSLSHYLKCYSHTQTIFRMGLRELLPSSNNCKFVLSDFITASKLMDSL